MAVSFARLTTGRLTASAIAVYTATGNTQIDALTLTNNDASAQTVNIWAAAGGGASDDNILIRARSVAAGETVLIYEAAGHVIPSGGSLYAQASVANVVTLIASGREQT